MNKNKTKNSLCEDNIMPDKELQTWEKWIQIRKDECEHLAKKTGRKPVDLTMNILENVREDKERKIVLEHAQIEKKVSLRNSLWEQPARLKQRFYCDPVYEAHRTKAEIGKPEIIQHIGVPNLIQKTEKGLTGISHKKPCPLLNAEYTDYRQKREIELDDRIKKIDPYRPHIDELIVTGTKPKPNIELPFTIPEIKESLDVHQHRSPKNSIYALKINKTVIFKDMLGSGFKNLIKMQKDPGHENCKCWSYYFNTSLGKTGRAKLLLKNLGTVSLRYFWKEIKKPIAFVPETFQDQVFFFNKNENVIYPGQSQEIYLTFISNKPGIYHESWEFGFCNVSFFYVPVDKLVINLTGETKSNLEYIIRKSKTLKNAINISALKIIARSLIEEIITNITSIQNQVYPYKHLLLESEMFEMKNPVCFFHQTEISKLKELYTEMVPGELWDLSIVSWRKAMMDMNFDERMHNYELLRKSHRELLKPWYEGEELTKQKHRAVYILLGQLMDKFDDEYTRLMTVVNDNYPRRQNESALLSSTSMKWSLTINDDVLYPIRNIFYLHIYEQFTATIEMCAAVMSSLDLNKWIHFDFCRN